MGEHLFSIVVLNVKVLIGRGTFNQEKTLVGAFSMMVKLHTS